MAFMELHFIKYQDLFNSFAPEPPITTGADPRPFYP